MAPKKKQIDSSIPTTASQKLKDILAEQGLSSVVKFADEYSNPDTVCTSTGFPQLDVLLNAQLKGLPQGCDVEIYSKEPETGKTTLALQILKAWQDAGKATALLDIEHTVTKSYLNHLGIMTDPEQDPNKIAMFWTRHENEVKSLEEVLNILRKLSQIFDLVIVDSVAAMELKANIEKESDENNKIAGASLKLSEFTKKNTCKKATVIWINQTRMDVGGYSPAGQPPRQKTTGGKALPFFCSIRLEMSVVERKKHPTTGEIIAHKVNIFSKKNKTSIPERNCTMTLQLGDGFTPIPEYIEFALEMGLITKKSGWFQFDELIAEWKKTDKAYQLAKESGTEVEPPCKIQGERNLYTFFKENPEIFETMKTLVDGLPDETEPENEFLEELAS